VTIAEVAGKSAQVGLIPFLTFLAIVSISLGVLNLLPIPILDGGHLFMYLIEAIKGSPLNETAEMMLQRVGLTLLLCLMALALFNDFERLFHFMN
jgi:regulator of sigma E protease